MTQIAAQPLPSETAPGTAEDIRRARADLLLHGCLLAGLGLLTGAVAWQDVELLREFSFLRTQVLVAEIAAGIGAAASFGGAMHYLDKLCQSRDASGKRVRWYWRWLISLGVRALLVAQIGGTLLIVGAMAGFLFDADAKLPPRDRGYLYRGWEPPKAPVDTVRRIGP